MQQNWKGLGTYGTVGLEFVLSFLLGLWLGHQGDRWLSTTPWLALVGSGFGLAAGFRAIWQAAQRANQDAEREEREERARRKKYLDDPPRRDSD